MKNSIADKIEDLIDLKGDFRRAIKDRESAKAVNASDWTEFVVDQRGFDRAVGQIDLLKKQIAECKTAIDKQFERLDVIGNVVVEDEALVERPLPMLKEKLGDVYVPLQRTVEPPD